jgi:hypothetical protein
MSAPKRKRQAPAPLATIIIPTHDRAATLACSIESALNQTIHDLEVVVVGDGCSDACRRIAHAYAAREERVMFRDLPKAPMRGVANRDLAVREAKGKLIFYNDDDDLLLPQHVAVLSRALVDADIVDTPAISISPSGQIDLGLHDSSHPLQRRLLASGELKTVFDTHAAHRKDAYLALGSPWLGAKDWNVTMHMFGAFAADTRVRWRSLQRITALSFHGRRRIAMTAEERRQELAQWSRHAKRPLFQSFIRRRGSYSFHTLRLVTGFAKGAATRQETEAWLTGLLRDGSAPFGATLRQRRAVETILTLVFGGALSAPGARQVFADLLDARLGPDFGPARQITDLFRARLGDDQLLTYLSAQPITPEAVFAELYLRAPAGFAHSLLMRKANDAFASAPSATRFHFAEAVARLLFEARQPEASWDWIERATPLVPKSFHSTNFWSLRMHVARALNYNEQAEIAASQMQLQRDQLD